MTQNGLQFATLRRWAHRSWPPSAPPTSTTSRRPTRRRPTCSARSTTSSTNRPSPWWPSRSVPPSLSLSLSLSFSVSLTQRCLVALLLRPQCNHYLAVPSLRLFGRRWSLSGCFTEFYLVFFFDDLPVCNHYRVLPSLRLRWSLSGCFTEFYLVFFLRRPSTLDQSISRVN